MTTVTEMKEKFMSGRNAAIFGNYDEAIVTYNQILYTLDQWREPTSEGEEEKSYCRQTIEEELKVVEQLAALWKVFPKELCGKSGKNQAGNIDDSQPFLDDWIQPHKEDRRDGPEIAKKDPDVWSPPPDRRNLGVRGGGAFAGDNPSTAWRASSNRMGRGAANGRDVSPRGGARGGLSNYGEPPRAKATPPRGRTDRDRTPPRSNAGAQGVGAARGRAERGNLGGPTGGARQGDPRERAPSKNAAPATPRDNRPPQSEYLLSVYPDGHGPHAELIQSLEDEVMLTSKPTVTFDDIAGLKEVIDIIKEVIVIPLMFPDHFLGLRRPAKAVLLYGPPGTGKTTLAKAIACQCNTTFMNVSVGMLASKYRGDSERLIRLLFQMARYYAPTTIFIDEIDSIAGERGGSQEHEASRRVKTELLTQMDGIHENNEEGETPKPVTVVAATNRPWDLDQAIKRRMEKRVYIPLPSFEGRLKAFEVATSSSDNSKLLMDDSVEFGELAEKTEGYSCADITQICREAAMAPVRILMKKGNLTKEALEKDLASTTLNQGYFLEAIRNNPRSVNPKHLAEFDEWTRDNQSGLGGGGGGGASGGGSGQTIDLR